MERIRSASAVDSEATSLRGMISQGWPSARERCPTELGAFWRFRSELTTENEIILRNTAVFIPKSLRREMLELAHSGHYRFEASWERARECILWPSLKAELREWCDSCSSCLSYQPRQPKEKLSLTPDATYPFQIIYQDLFTHSGKQYLVTVDVYSDYFEIDDLGADTTAERLVRATQKHFSRYGAPMELHSDNGPQFTSATFQDFLASWGTVHVTSSPYFPQSNGKAEAAVKVAKGLLKKCKINGEEYEYALLELRNTIQSDGLSRAQKFFSRPLRSKLPSRMDSNFIFDENLVENNESKRKKVK
ncbi:uncharacterized protein K02A2.6-like [Galendromus occidentalis]|uniref:RNA-directed DNA polymerase n=1 Tax=Galendromus occidentalis TaxID=34638 RepID=A0AAJ6QPI4_9ACAR|nr:uncharacterized protein K02A2.6-like [Galendromus occidentalis]